MPAKLNVRELPVTQWCPSLTHRVMFRRSFLVVVGFAPLACGGRGGTNGNCKRFRGLGLSRCQHVALPFEESARFDD
jgi:hypothetical protein